MSSNDNNRGKSTAISNGGKKSIKFHGDAVANVVIDMHSKKGGNAIETDTFDAMEDPLPCETINIQVIADFVSITFYRNEQSNSIIQRELIPYYRVERILIKDLEP
jgi:hypothetical protein